MSKLATEPETPLASQLFILERCQGVLRARLEGPLRKLFEQLTGLRLHIWWQDARGLLKADPFPILCPTAKRNGHDLQTLPPVCRDCLHQRWRGAIRSNDNGRRFTGACGSTNFCAGLEVEGVRLLALVLQDGRGEPALAAGSKPPTSPARRKRLATGAADSALQRGKALARLLLHDLRASFAAEQSQPGWTAVQSKLQRLEIENARLHRELHGRFADLPEAPQGPGVRSHAHQIVERVQAYVIEHYHRPLQLADVAAALHLNPSYVSDLFSHAAGTTFHYYLAEIRLAKAKELLRNPTLRVCEVACAVGYASTESFGHAFRVLTGLTPSAWRQQA